MGCDTPQDKGTFFVWQAPANGKVTLAESTRVVDDDCRCIPTDVSTLDVTTGQVVRIWTSLLKDIQPLRFVDTTVNQLNACPTDFDFQLTFEGGTFVESNVLSPRPVCDREEDSTEEGIFVDWVAPSDGTVLPASSTIFVDKYSCACDDAVEDTFHVNAGERVRAWTPLRTGQPFEFVPDE